MSFGKRLREARLGQGMSQGELARACNFDASAISHFENGGRLPSLGNLIKVANGVRVSTDFLLGLTETMNGRTGTVFDDILKLPDHHRKTFFDLARMITVR